MIELKDVEAARQRIDDYVYYSPLARSETLSQISGAPLYLKLENLQMTGSFKDRGAFNRVLQLGEEDRARGVVTSSAGNHAQAVAYLAQRLGIEATIAMPENAPLTKVSNTRRHGAEVVLCGETYQDAYNEALAIQKARGAIFVRPFDDAQVIAGQGTIGLELLEQEPGLEAVVVPVGGGGLVAGIAVALKAHKPNIEVIGVEAAAFAGAGPDRRLGTGGLVGRRHSGQASGRDALRPDARVRGPGGMRGRGGDCAGDSDLVGDRKDRGRRRRGGGAGGGVGGQGGGRWQEDGDHRQRRQYRCQQARADYRARSGQRRAADPPRVQVPDRPGSLEQVTGIIAAQKANVLEVLHERDFHEGPVDSTGVFFTLETRGREHAEEVIGQLIARGFQPEEER